MKVITARIYKDKECIGITEADYYLEASQVQIFDVGSPEPIDLIRNKRFKVEMFRASFLRDKVDWLFNSTYHLHQTLPFDLVFFEDDIAYVFENCWIMNHSGGFWTDEVFSIINANVECEKLTTYTKERYEAMACNNGKCNPEKQDMKDKAIKMLRDSFEKQLKSVEKIACRKNSPSTERARKELLDKFEAYLRELLVC